MLNLMASVCRYRTLTVIMCFPLANVLRTTAGECQDQARQPLVVAIKMMATGEFDGAGGAWRKIRAQRPFVPGTEYTQGLGARQSLELGQNRQTRGRPDPVGQVELEGRVASQPQQCRRHDHVAGRHG